MDRCPVCSNWLQIQSSDLFEGVFRIVQLHSGRVFAPFHIGGRKVNLPQYTRDQDAVDTVDLSGQIGTEKRPK